MLFWGLGSPDKRHTYVALCVSHGDACFLLCILLIAINPLQLSSKPATQPEDLGIKVRSRPKVAIEAATFEGSKRI